jgi:ABC-2 type transport system permease protein
MVAFLVLVSFAFSLFGFIIGIWAQSFEQLNFIPMLIVTPLTFLGGAFYTIDMLPEAWRGVAMLNPVVHLISGFRWSFFELQGDHVGISLAVTLGFVLVLLAVVAWIFKTGYRLKN